jgi:hypothetical protein
MKVDFPIDWCLTNRNQTTAQEANTQWQRLISSPGIEEE